MNDRAIRNLQTSFERRRRPYRPAAAPTSATFAELRKEVAKADAVAAYVLDLWREPLGELRNQIRQISFARGVLAVKVRNATARFQIDRILRSGLQTLTIRGCKKPITRITLHT